MDSKVLQSMAGDDGTISPENVTPHAQGNFNFQNRETPQNEVNSPNYDDKPTLRAVTEGPHQTEMAPFIAKEQHQRASKPVTLTFKDLSYTVWTKNVDKKNPSDPKYVHREILRGMTGVCRPGELTAIMGTSGAGKTTLLNILSCRITEKGKNKLNGEFLANGNPYDLSKFSKFAGYVMQNDILFETMTPREIFTFTANLRLPGTHEERIKKVNNLLQNLKLERAADTLVGGTFAKGISGGERKRTSIGVELITDPNLIFLDEPTSGLDSFTAFILISLLKNLAVKEGKTVIFTIHQPSSDIFFLFDRLMILAKGKFIYQGPTRNAVDHFGSIGYQCPEYSNPADYFIEIAHADHNSDDKFALMYKAYDEKLAPAIEKEVVNQDKKEIALAQNLHSWFSSMTLIAKRSLLNFLRNPILFKGRVGQTAFFIFLLCVLYFKVDDGINPDNLSDPANTRVIYDINGGLFFFTIAVFMSSSMTVVLTFPAERAVFLREYSSNMYSVSSYFFGRSTTELPFVIIFPMIMGAISYYIIGFNDYNPGKVFFFMLILVFQSLCGNAVGILVGSIFSDVKVATNVVPVILLPWMIFSGMYANADTMPDWLGWFQYTSPFRYSLESLMWNQYTDYPLGDSQLAIQGYTIGKWGSFGLLAAVGTIVRFAALFFLKLLVRNLE